MKKPVRVVKQKGFNAMEQTYPLISVIVPVYKTEPYLARCVESILNQQYENLEIFLIDDGSPDHCGEMCDGYAQRDARVKVIHKENGGQSSARNDALDAATGAYITFVDSDDALEPDAIGTLYDALVRTKSDIAICGFRKITGAQQVEENAFSEDTVIDGAAVLETMIVDETIGSQPCAKLFAAPLFDGVRFPVGRIYEDLAMMHLPFSKAKRIVCLKACKYLYYIRDDSTSFSVSDRWYYGLFRAFFDRLVFARKQELTREAQEICLAKTSYFAIRGLRHWNRKDSKDYIEEGRQFLKDNRNAVLSSDRISKKNKLKAMFAAYLYPVFRTVFR